MSSRRPPPGGFCPARPRVRIRLCPPSLTRQGAFLFQPLRCPLPTCRIAAEHRHAHRDGLFGTTEMTLVDTPGSKPARGTASRSD